MSCIRRWTIVILVVLIALLLLACSNGAAATSVGEDSDTQAIPPGFAMATFTVPTVT